MTTLEGPPLEAAEGVGALTIGGFINEVSARFAGNEALVFDDPLRPGTTVRWSYAELGRQARAVASALIAAGFGKGSRVGILMGNRPEAVAAYFGAPMMGAVAVPFRPSRRRRNWITCSGTWTSKSSSRSRGCSIDDLWTTWHLSAGADDRAARRGSPAAHAGIPVSEEGGSRRAGGGGGAGGAVGGLPFTWRRNASGTEGVIPADHGQIIYSSGTTDRPKGILHNHRAPTLQFWLQARVFDRTERTRLWTALPMFWTAGLHTAMGATLAAGGCWVMQESFAAGEALRLMERERVTEPYCLPHQTAALEEHPDWLRTDLSSLRCVLRQVGVRPAPHGPG